MAMTTATGNPVTQTNSNSSPNQNNFTDDQIYEIDIDKMYNDYITYIDNKRSYVNIVNQNVINLLSSISGSMSKSANTLVPAKSYQESRCSAFFRILGFPVTDSTQSRYFNPGHDIVNPERILSTGDKYAITQDLLSDPTKFVALSNAREQYFLSQQKIFNTNTTVDAGVLALSCGISPTDKRPFAVPFTKTTGPFDLVPADQFYSPTYISSVGMNTVLLSAYINGSGNMPAAATLPPNRPHIILPFITDPRIDFSCSPSTNRIAIPFVPNKSFLQVASNVYTDPPLIETIIRNRIGVNNQLMSAGNYTQQFAKFITDVSNNPDQTILGQIAANDIQQLSTNSQFLQFVNIIQAMIIKLVGAQKNIAKAQGQYYWLPIPSTTGPEGGSTVQGVFLPNAASQTAGLVTEADGKILIATAQSLFSQSNQNPQAAAAPTTPDPGGFAIVVENSLGPASSASYVSNSQSTLDMLGAKRLGILNDASDALRIVEIIMGEFSGLGLCDIIAVLAALYTMPAQNLIGFLDTFAQARLNTQYNQTFPVVSYQTAMTSFTSTVNQFYQLMEALYTNIYYNQGVSS
jgi:hypothetical protein